VRVRRRSVRCPACDATWSRRGVRFCGHCGAATEGTIGAPPAGETTRTGPAAAVRGLARGGPRAAAAGVVGIAVVAFVALGGPSGTDLPWRTPADPPDPDIALPTPGALTPRVEPATGPPSPTTLACQPIGCEAWRLPLERPHDGWYAADELLLSFSADAATAIDLTTGAARWTRALGGLLPRTSDGTPLRDLRSGSHVTVAADGRDVAIGMDDRLALLDAAFGEPRWLARSTDGALSELSLLDGVVVGTTPARPPGSGDVDAPGVVGLVAFDRGDGTERWRRPVQATIDLSRQGLAVIDPEGRLVSYDPDDGEPRWERDLPPGTWATRAGPWLLVDVGTGHELVDPATGTVVAVLPGWLGHDVRAVGGRYISVLLPVDRARGRGASSAGAEVIAVETDGTVAWRRPVDLGAPWTCCTAIVPWNGGVLVAAAEGAGALHLDPDDGTPLTAPITLPVPEGMWASPAGRLVGWRPDGVVVAADDGRFVEVAGPELELVSLDPFVVHADGELLGLRTYLPRGGLGVRTSAATP
jgi:hypothetical protein